MGLRVVIPIALISCVACSAGGSAADIGDNELAVRAVVADPSGCYRPGQEVLISGGGFAPGIEVNLDVRYANNGSLIALVTADGEGNISRSIQLPQSTGTVGFDAAALGPTGEDVQDMATIELTPPGSTCGN